MKKKTPKPSRDFTEAEAIQIGNELLEWFHQKDDHIYVDDFLLITKKLLATDVEYLIATFPAFKESLSNADKIELAKLKKYASADRLNASIVKTIMTNKHDWL